MSGPIKVRGDAGGRYLEVTIDREGWRPSQIEIVASPKGRVWSVDVVGNSWFTIRFPNGAHVRISNTEQYGGHASLYDRDGRWVDGGYVNPDGTRPDRE